MALNIPSKGNSSIENPKLSGKSPRPAAPSPSISSIELALTPLPSATAPPGPLLPPVLAPE